ncbi:MAG: class I SAM-dependent methyltransferase [Anaerolineae bacterium]|nr:class I SAM-dependent methyltransferase [Anaerolineae bacterium]
MASDFNYVGDELEVFQHALNWKSYWRDKIQKYMGRNVLEVGAGIGGTTRVLLSDQQDRWVALEPDSNLAKELELRRRSGDLPTTCEVRNATIFDLEASDLFDTIVYIDVLEHIECDSEEVMRASQQLEAEGHLIVLSPAFQSLYTPFDKAIGHYRRYTKSTLQALTPHDCKLVASFYLDSIGMLTSLANLVLLRSTKPSLNQILLWDRFLVPVSRRIDPLLGHPFGRSVICVWQRIT